MTNKKNNSRRGQVLVEFLVGLKLEIICTTMLMLVLLCLFAVTMLNAEAYSLARSTLYGASPTCRASGHWPPLRNLEIQYQCTNPGRVTANLNYSPLTSPLIEYQTQVNLR